jgi:hypothetical protein
VQRDIQPGIARRQLPVEGTAISAQMIAAHNEPAPYGGPAASRQPGWRRANSTN